MANNFINVYGEKRIRTGEGTLAYLAPEVEDTTSKYNYLVDIWALGIILYELLHKRYAFGLNREFLRLKKSQKKNMEIVFPLFLDVMVLAVDTNPSAPQVGGGRP